MMHGRQEQTKENGDRRFISSHLFSSPYEAAAYFPFRVTEQKPTTTSQGLWLLEGIE